MDEFLIFIEENKEMCLGVFNEYYHEKAYEEGSDMQDDERYYGDDGFDMEPEEIYEDFAHCTGHSASYHGAYGVILELGEAFMCDPNDEELQWEVMLMLGREPE